MQQSEQSDMDQGPIVPYSRRAFLGRVGAGVAVGAITLATQSFDAQATAEAIAEANSKYATVRSWYPWLPPCTMLDTQPEASCCWYAGYNAPLGRYEISFPRDVVEHPHGRIEHESGHIMAYYVYNSRGPNWTGQNDLFNEFIAYMGGDPSVRNHPQIHEIWAEHFAKAHVDNYTPIYPDLINLVPFNAQRMKDFCASIAIGEDGLKWIEGDRAVFCDANGNAVVTNIVMSGAQFRSGVPILGIASRIGLAGTEGSLPDAYFYPTSTSVGILMVKGDPQRNANAFFRLAAFQ